MNDWDEDRNLATGAKRVLAAKQAMIESFPVGYVHDPAVLFLMGLFIRHVDGGNFTRRGLCDAAAHVPFAAATRWLMALERDGLVDLTDATSADPIVELTDKGFGIVRSSLFAIGRAQQQVRQEKAADAPFAFAQKRAGFDASRYR